MPRPRRDWTGLSLETGGCLLQINPRRNKHCKQIAAQAFSLRANKRFAPDVVREAPPDSQHDGTRRAVQL